MRETATLWPCLKPDFTGEGLDPGIQPMVEALVRHGVQTVESCEGGEGHAWPEPTIRFWGDAADGLHALAVALKYRFPVAELRRVWAVYGSNGAPFTGELQKPVWELVFIKDD